MGPSGQENASYGNLTSASGFATNLGEGDLTASSDFMKSILSGDATKTAQALAPQISAAKVGAQQQKKTQSQFGGRSGGTAASGIAADDKTHSDITDLIGDLTGKSASGLAATGASTLGLGLSGDAAGFDEAKQMQAQRAAQVNDIFSSSASVAESAFGAVPGAPGGVGDVGSNIAGSF